MAKFVKSDIGHYNFSFRAKLEGVPPVESRVEIRSYRYIEDKKGNKSVLIEGETTKGLLFNLEIPFETLSIL